MTRLEDQECALLKRSASRQVGDRRIQYWIDERKKHLGEYSYIVEVLDLKTMLVNENSFDRLEDADRLWKRLVS